MHFRTGRLRFAGSAGALARNEREAHLAAVLSYLERLCAGEGVRAKAPAFPVIRSDYRNCISTHSWHEGLDQVTNYTEWN